jgi:hypothetical protein
MESKKLRLTSIGTHNVRYNSLVPISDDLIKELGLGPFALFPRGTKLCAISMETGELIMEDHELLDEHIIVLKQANKNLFTACTYDADFIIFSLDVEEGKLTVKPLKRISQFCCEYRYVRRLALNASNTHLAFLSECVERQLS